MKQETKFKDTEIGGIPEEWEILRIGDVADVIGGGTPSTKDKDNFGGDISWITPKDLSNYKYRYIKKGTRNITEKGLKNSSAKLLPKGTVLLTTRAPIGYVVIAENEVTTNQGFRSLIPNKKTTSEFLYYQLKLNTERLKSNASGTTFGELAGSRLKAIKFTFPSLQEQTSIAKILSDLDLKIELLQKQNKTLEAIGQAIFKHWFVDFEFPDEEGKPYKSSGGEMVFYEELGKEIPKGWEVSKIGTKLKVILGGTPDRTKKEYWNGDVNWINSGKVNEFRITE
ncbi:MAG: restriction endonuclease subunit S, partial [Methanophagales archaeon]|nr:restriction endonuclease subunit S [Methanophagales archaeon]